jgi:hypothetical protein
MRCIYNAATDVQDVFFEGTGLTISIVYHDAEQGPHWTAKMKYPNIRGSSHLMFHLVDGKYKIGALKQNNFPDELFDSIADQLLREANKVSTDTETRTLTSS